MVDELIIGFTIILAGFVFYLMFKAMNLALERRV